MRVTLSGIYILLVASRAEEDPCQCLNWKEVYASGKAVCGEALEFWSIFGGRTNMSLEEAVFMERVIGWTHYEICTGFLERMDNNYCVNIANHQYETLEWHAGQWCYVSRDCNELNGGHKVPDKETFPDAFYWIASLADWMSVPMVRLAKFFHTPEPVPRDLSWKVCTREGDKRLREMPPLEVLNLAKSMDSSIGVVTKHAYPRLLPPEFTWGKVENLVAQGDLERMPRPLRNAIVAGDPVVIDVSPEGYTYDQRIIRGKEVYELKNQCDMSGCGAKQWPFRRGKDVGEL